MKYTLIISLLFLLSCSYGEKKIYIELEDASGIEKGSEIFLKGQKIGSINDLAFDNLNWYAESRVGNDINIPVNARFEKFSTDIFGTKAIEVIFEENKPPFLKNRDTVKCYLNDETIIDSVFNTIHEIAVKIKDSLVYEKKDSIWIEFASALENKDLDYLIQNSMDTIQCVDCISESDKEYFSSKYIFKNHIKELMHLESLTDKKFSSSFDGDFIRINYTIKWEKAPEGAYNLIFSFKKVDNKYLFNGMFTVP